MNRKHFIQYYPESICCVHYVVTTGLTIYSYSPCFHKFLRKSFLWEKKVYNLIFHALNIVPLLPFFLLINMQNVNVKSGKES